MDSMGVIVAAIVGLAAISLASIALGIHVHIYIAKQAKEFPILNRRIDRLSKRLNDIEFKIGRRFSSIEGRIEQIGSGRQFSPIDNRTEQIDAGRQFSSIDSRLTRIDERIKHLQNENAEIRVSVQYEQLRINQLSDYNKVHPTKSHNPKDKKGRYAHDTSSGNTGS